MQIKQVSLAVHYACMDMFAEWDVKNLNGESGAAMQLATQFMRQAKIVAPTTR